MRYWIFLGLLSAGLLSCSGTSESTKSSAPPAKTQITSAKVQGSTLVIAATYFAPGTTASLGGTAMKLTSSKGNEISAALPEPLTVGTPVLRAYEPMTVSPWSRSPRRTGSPKAHALREVETA